MALKLPRFDRSIPITNENRTPSLPFHTWWQRALNSIESSFNQLETIVLDIQAAQNAANAAQAAADSAQASADAATSAAASSNSVASLTNSGVTGCTISATDAGTNASVTISSHTRVYGDGTSVVVTGATLTGRAYSTFYYIYYEDAARTGGAVTYLTTTDEAVAVQTGNRHIVGSITTPAAAGANTNGAKLPPPGQDGIQP